MRLFIMAIVFVIIADVSKAQQADSIRFEYCEVNIVDTDLFKKTVYIEIDFGDQKQVKSLKHPDTGKTWVFNSPIDALNFLGKQGWEVITVHHQEAYPRNRYLLKRNVARTNAK